ADLPSPSPGAYFTRMPDTHAYRPSGHPTRAAGLVLLSVLMSCTPGEGGAGRLTARWKGGDSGQLVAPATGAWCSVGGLLEIMAISGDSGVAVLLYPTNGVKAGSFTVIDPLRQPVHAGGAAVAMRWPSAEQIVGYRGVSGTASLKVEDGKLSGEWTGLLLRPGAEMESLHVSGSFDGIRADSGPAACPPDSGRRERNPGTADSGTHSDHP
ncbi:MAG TPA: hypothetical protein VMJ30_08625, partial [Gemmatimonadales bacterium]|nr:hypothetical protein [Gemmatimonadales bacterium]